MLYHRGDNWFIASQDDLKASDAGGAPGKSIHADQMEARIDPRAEWKQEYNEAWRIEREFFYDPGYHGLNLAKIEAKYRPWVEGLTTRSDLTYLMNEMLGEITVGHMFIAVTTSPAAMLRRTACWALITRSSTAITSSRISLPAATGARACIRRSRSRA